MSGARPGAYRRGPSRGTRVPGDRLRIRKARPGDSAALAAVMRSSVRTLARGAYPPRTLGAWSSLPALYHAWAMGPGGETCFAAERGGRIVGYASLRGRELTALFVRPGAARTGVGRALLARVEREAHRLRVRALVTKAALSGVPFYRAYGFSGERRVRVPLPGGGVLAAVLLVKPLQPATAKASRSRWTAPQGGPGRPRSATRSPQ